MGRDIVHAAFGDLSLQQVRPLNFKHLQDILRGLATPAESHSLIAPVVNLKRQRELAACCSFIDAVGA